MFGQLGGFRNWEDKSWQTNCYFIKLALSCVINYSSCFLKVFIVASEIEVDTT